MMSLAKGVSLMSINLGKHGHIDRNQGRMFPSWHSPAIMLMIRSILTAAWMTALLAGTAFAQDIAAGARVAQSQCAGCHQIGRVPGKAPGLAPSFAEIAATPAMTQTSIEVFLSTPHEGMPNYSLSQRNIADVAAYIVSLRGAERGHATQ
jgi:mono/diheme cytochrome c family protein